MRTRHIRVFGVNIDSPNRYHVKIGNIIRPVHDARNLADHADSVASTTNFQPYQNITDVGTPMMIADSRALSFQYSEMDWEFNWNQPTVCPKKKSNIPRYITLSDSKCLCF